LVSPLNEEIEEETEGLQRDEVELAKYAKMSPQTIPDKRFLETEENYLSKLEALLGKMQLGLGKEKLEDIWTIVPPEPGQKYPDSLKFKLEYGRAKQELIKEAKKSLVEFDPGTLNTLFWNIQGDPTRTQMLTAQKEFTIIEGLLDIITDPETAVRFVYTLAVNPGPSKVVPVEAVRRIVRERPRGAEAGPGRGGYRIIPIKLVLDIDYRTLNVLVDEILRSGLKINLNIRRIQRLGRVGDRAVQPLVRVDMDMAAVDFNPTL